MADKTTRSYSFFSFKSVLIYLVLLVSVSIYVIWIGGPFHSPQCILFKHNCPPILIDGYVGEGYETVKDIFTRHFETGMEVGSCVMASVKGKTVVDLCGGFAGDKPYRGSLQVVFSNSKAVCAIVMAILADRGLVSYEDKISKYWPEFAQNGKEDVTLGDLVRHASGVAYLDEPIPLELLKDFDKLAVTLARQKHNHNGTRTVAYHAMTQGLYMNEIVRRVDPQKRTIGQFIQEEINAKLNTEFYFVVPEASTSKVAKLFYYPATHMFGKILPSALVDRSNPNRNMLLAYIDKDSALYKSFHSLSDFTVDSFNEPRAHQCEIPAGNGVSSASSMLTLAQLMANRGEVNGVRLLSQETADRVTSVYETQYDHVLHINVTRTVGGFGAFSHIHERFKMIGWSGFGGSMFLWDPENQIAFTYIMNALHPGLATNGGRGLNLCREILSKVQVNK